MMNNPYDLHSYSKLCREDALHEARKRHLVERARADRELRGLRRVGIALSGALNGLKG